MRELKPMTSKNGRAVYPVTPMSHMLDRYAALAKRQAAIDAYRKDLRKRMEKMRAEQLLDRYGVERDDPRWALVQSAVMKASRAGVDVDDPQVSLAIAHKALAAHARAQTRENTDVVYYVRIGDLIKVGTTRNLKRRFNAYPPGAELLATEVGSFELESERIGQFAEYLASRREWFNPGDRLMAHIAQLQRDATVD